MFMRGRFCFRGISYPRMGHPQLSSHPYPSKPYKSYNLGPYLLDWASTSLIFPLGLSLVVFHRGRTSSNQVWKIDFLRRNCKHLELSLGLQTFLVRRIRLRIWLLRLIWCNVAYSWLSTTPDHAYFGTYEPFSDPSWNSKRQPLPILQRIAAHWHAFCSFFIGLPGQYSREFPWCLMHSHSS